MIPGEIITAEGAAPLLANAGLGDQARWSLRIPATVPSRSAAIFISMRQMPRCDFDRAAARGFRLNIPAGTAVRFEPGDTKEMELVALAGERRVYGLNNKIDGDL